MGIIMVVGWLMVEMKKPGVAGPLVVDDGGI
jgi:hypothetical protein